MGNVTVLKIEEFNFAMNVTDINVSENETIYVYLPSDISGIVTITIKDTTYIDVPVIIESGVGSFNVSDLPSGRYHVYASLSEDKKYIDNTIDRTFLVSTISNYDFALTYNSTVFVRDNITFTLQLPEDAKGNVTLTIFDKSTQYEIKNGLVTINVSAKEDGTFPFIISFEQEGKYNYKSQEAYVVVSKKDSGFNPIYSQTVNVDENVTFVVVLPSDATGNISVVTRGVTYAAKLVNGSANVTILGYPLSSVYSPTIFYTGDDKYYSNSLTANINVVRVSDYELNVTVNNITVEDNEVVNITLPSDATDDVLISGNFSTETYSRLISNGKASFVISNLPAGTYSITVRYQGYSKYDEKSVTKTFTVKKVVPSIEIDFVNDDTVIVKLPDNANGFANVTVGDEIDTQIEIINGKGVLDVSNLRPGDYLVNATFLGGLRYLENSTIKTITMPKIKDYSLPIVVRDITVGENATITINAPEGANGNINITIDDGEIIEVPIINGVAKYNATKLAVGTHNVTVRYANKEYSLKANETEFKVKKINVIITDTIVSNATELSLNVTLTEGVTGNVTISIDGTPYEFTNINSNKLSLTVPIIPGEHDIIITYSGDENHTDQVKTDYVFVSKISDYTIGVEVSKLITVLDNNQIVVTLPIGVTGQVHIYVNNMPYPPVSIDSTTGKAVLTLPTLASDNYTVVVTFSSDIYDYKENTTNFTVIKLNTTLDVEVANITNDLVEEINITLNENTTGEALVNVSGTVYHVTIDDGVASLPLSNLNNGNYTVIVTYLGDYNYNSNTTVVRFTVSKIPLNIKINTTNIVTGQEANFQIETSRPVTDIVSVKIGNNTYTTFIYEGKGNLTVTNLNIGNYNVTVMYAGDEEYLSATNVTKINVSDKTPTSVKVNVTSITIGETVTIYVNVTGASEGTVTIAMLGNPINTQLKDGVASFTYDNLTARDYHFTVSYLENDLYLGSNATGDFTVFKKQSNISINISNSHVGDLDVANLTVSDGATGNVLISIGDLHIYVQLNGTNNLKINLTEFTIGSYNVTATYTGDDIFNGSSTKTSFNVTKRQTTINITTDDVIVVGHPVTFTIITSANFTEVVTVTIINKNTGETIISNHTFVENGKGSYVVYDLVSGDYTAKVLFSGNTQYDLVENSTNFTVSTKSATSLSVSVNNITLGEDVVIYVNVTGASTGSVTLAMAGNPQTKEVIDGKVNFTVHDLIARNYHLTVMYNENDDYLSSNKTADFTVFRKNSPINASVVNATVGDVELVTVEIPVGATGTVLLTVNGTNYYGKINKGVAKFNVTGLPVGNHTAYITYEGDGNYLDNSTEINLTTAKRITTINITTDEVIVVGYPVTFTIISSANFTEVVTVTIKNGLTGESVLINNTFVENGKGSFVVYGLQAGEYVAHVYFPGNTQYDDVDNSTEFTIAGKSETSITVEVANVTVDDDVVIYVNVTGATTGRVTIAMAGMPQTKEISDGKANFTFSGLEAGNYHLTAYYRENDDYLGSNTTADVTVSKIATAITFEVSDINVGQKAVIKVHLNESTPDAITVHINGVKYTLINYEDTIEVNGLPEGTIVVSAEFDGNNRLSRASNETTFKVTKNTTSIKITTHNIDAGQKEIIEMHLAADINGVLEVTVGNVSYAAVIKQGVAKLELENLASGSYNVTAVFYGNERYINTTGNASFVVSHVTSFVFDTSAEVRDNAVVINVTLPSDVNGKFNVTINGVNYTGFVVAGEGSVVVPNLPGKEYNVPVYFDGNDKYAPATANVEFTVNKVTPNMKIDYNSIYVGENATITVILPESATGNVTLTINNTNISQKVQNGTVVFSIPGLADGSYTFAVNYTGDGRYLAASISAELKVNKLSNHTIHIIAEDIHVGDVAVINVTLPSDATGIVTITIDGNDYDTDMLVNGKGNVTVRGLSKGTYNITAEYKGDLKYGYIKDNAHITVKKYENYLLNVTITNGTNVGENATITVKLPNDVTNKVNITVAGVTTEVDVANGVANLTVKVTGEQQPVIVTYGGDDKYETATIITDLSGNKITGYEFTIKGDAIELGQIAEVWYFLPDDAYLNNANVTINVSGRNVFHMAVNQNGTGFAPFPNLPIGVYNVTVTYGGNNKYASSIRHTQITVTKVSEYNMDVTVNEANVGENLTFEIKLPSDAGGIVNVTIVTVELGNKTYNVTVINGTANLTIPADDLEDDSYEAIVYYSGDSKYENITKTVSIDIVKVVGYDFSINALDISVDDTETITIDLPEDVNEVIIIKVGNKTYDVTIINGHGEKNITGLKYGSYDVEVTFVNSKYDKRTKYTSFKVSRISTDINMTYPPEIKVGKNATVEVEVPLDSKGNVTIVINNVPYTGEIKDGKAIINITGLNEGSYQFTANFEDDSGKYLPDSEIGLIVVSKSDIELKPTYSNITVGQNATINVELAEGAEGTVTLIIDGRTFTKEIKNGNVIFKVSDLDADNHTFIISYDGDRKYNGDVFTGTLKATKVSDYSWNFDVCDIKVGQDEIINITLPDDATGNLIITIGNVSYHHAANGNTTYTVSGLKNGTYNIIIQYQGNGKYTNKTITKSFNVSTNNVKLEIEVIDRTVVVTLPDDAKGKVNITIGNKTELVDIIGGKATLDVSDVAPGDYTVTANYSGDDKYNGNLSSKQVNLPKFNDYEASVDVINTTYGNNATVIVKLPDDINGKVNITVDGETKEVDVKNGIVNYEVPNLTIGDHNVTVSFLGNEKYDGYFANATINVKGVDITPEVKVENGTVIVKVPENATGNVTITIGDETVEVPIVNGTASWNGTALEPGSHSVTAEYPGDNQYAPFTENASVIIPKFDPVINATALDISVGNKTTIAVNVPGDATGRVLVDVDGTGYYTDIKDGKAEIQVGGLKSGNYDVNITYLGDTRYNNATTTANFTVYNRDIPTMDVHEYNLEEGEDVYVTVQLPENATGNVTVSFDGFTETKEVNGTGAVTFNAGKHNAGNYVLNVNYDGDGNYAPLDSSKAIQVVKITDPHVNLSGEDIIDYYNHTVYKVRLLDLNNAPIVGKLITFKINGNYYGSATTDVLGDALIDIYLSVGTYSVEATFDGDGVFNSNTTNNSISIKSSIIASNIARGWNSPFDYEASFVNGSGNPLANQYVTFIINGKEYKVKTDAYGLARVTTSKLAVGSYDVIVVNGVTGEKVTRKTTIVARLIQNKDLTMDYLSGKSFSVLVIGDDGKPVGAGEYVSMTINTRTYAVKTNENGYAIRSIGLIPGSYTMVSTYKEYTVKNKVKVKQTLTSKSVKVKKSAKKLVLKATLKWSNGKAIKGKKITFKFNGKTYSAKTNGKGIAQVTIKKSVIKKLKAGKKYTVIVKYKDEKVKPKITVKK